jgi:hypothetical protein
MTLTNLRPFYELVTPERLEEYLRERGYEPNKELFSGDVRIGRWWRKSLRVDTSFVPVATHAAGDRVNRVTDAVSDLATAEERAKTAVLFDLLPAPARHNLVLALFPQLNGILRAGDMPEVK